VCGYTRVDELPVKTAPKSATVDEKRAVGYCLKCGYDLRALPVARCPECGRTFNLNERRSYAPRPIHRSLLLLILMYLAPLVLDAAFWITFVSAAGPRYGIGGFETTFRAVVFSGCGPLLLFLPNSWFRVPVVIYAVFGTLWGGLALIACWTPFRRIHYAAHSALALLAAAWWLAGTILVGISV
jgi:hypothetical protein